MLLPMLLLSQILQTLAAQRFAIVTVCSLAAPWVQSLDGQLGLIYSTQTASLYASIHNYSFVLATHPLPGEELENKRLDWAKLAQIERLFTNDDGSLNCSRYDYVFWMEADVFITNLTVRLEDIVERATAQHNDTPADLIINRDAAGNINTGTGFLRCSQTSLDILHRLSEIRHEYSTDSKVIFWASNGATSTCARASTHVRYTIFLAHAHASFHPSDFAAKP